MDLHKRFCNNFLLFDFSSLKLHYLVHVFITAKISKHDLGEMIRRRSPSVRAFWKMSPSARKKKDFSEIFKSFYIGHSLRSVVKNHESPK